MKFYKTKKMVHKTLSVRKLKPLRSRKSKVVKIEVPEPQRVMDSSDIVVNDSYELSTPIITIDSLDNNYDEEVSPPVITNDDDDVRRAVKDFKNAGLQEYLGSFLGKAKTTENIATCVKRLINYLFWSHIQINGEKFVWEIPIVDWLVIVLTEHYAKFAEYASYLEKRKGFSASTVCGHLYDIVEVSKWMGYFNVNYSGTNKIDLGGFMYVAQAMRKAYSKIKKTHMTENDLEMSIANRRLPVGGIKSLMRCVKNDIATAKEDYCNGSIDKFGYKHFMELLFASLYVFSVNGRCGGIEDMKYHQGEQLINHGFAMSRVFKTQATYGYQPVIISKRSKTILKIYLHHIRPLIKRNEDSISNDPLWLTWEGEKEREVSRKVTRYFKVKMNIHLTTNSIRSLIETEAKSMLVEGKITNVTRDAVSKINGHTSSIVESYYMLNNRANDVHNSRQMFEQLDVASIDSDNALASVGSDNLNDYESANFKPFDDFQYLKWGENHPEFAKDSKRAKWSDEEVSFIGEWCTNILKNNPEARRRIISDCWKYVTMGPGVHECLSIFHEIHILDATRFRHGYRKAQKLYDLLK
jgi:hypothetical protein